MYDSPNVRLKVGSSYSMMKRWKATKHPIAYRRIAMDSKNRDSPSKIVITPTYIGFLT